MKVRLFSAVILGVILLVPLAYAFTPTTINIDVSCTGSWVFGQSTQTQTMLSWNVETSFFSLTINGANHVFTGRGCAIYYLPVSSFVHLMVLCGGKLALNQVSTDQTVVTWDFGSNLFTTNTNGVIQQFASSCRILSVSW